MKIKEVGSMNSASAAFMNEALAYGTPGSRAMALGNFGAFSKFYLDPKTRTSPTLTLNFGGNNTVKLSEADVERLAQYYNQLPDMQAKKEFATVIMGNYNKFAQLTKTMNMITVPKQPTANPAQPDLFEKKNQEPADISRGKVRSSELNVLLKQAYAKYPQATSDIEALLMYDLDQRKNTDANFRQQDSTNRRQDDVMKQLSDLSRRQSQQIAALDSENEALNAELDRLEAEIPQMTQQVATQTTPGTSAPASDEREQARKRRETAKKDREQQIRQPKQQPDKKDQEAGEKKKDSGQGKIKDQGKRSAVSRKEVEDALKAAREAEKAYRDAAKIQQAKNKAEKAAAKATAAKEKTQGAQGKAAMKSMATGLTAAPGQAQDEVIPTTLTPATEPAQPDMFAQPVSAAPTGDNTLPWGPEVLDPDAYAQAQDVIAKAKLPDERVAQESSHNKDEKIGGRYDPDDFDAMVRRLGQRAKEQQRRHGPVDLQQLAQRLKDIQQRDDKK